MKRFLMIACAIALMLTGCVGQSPPARFAAATAQPTTTTATLNGVPMQRTMRAVAGRWNVATPGSLTILSPAGARTWRANGVATVDASPGLWKIAWRGGGYAEVTATTQPATVPSTSPALPPRSAVFSTTLLAERNKRGPIEERYVPRLHVVKFVSSDWDRPRDRPSFDMSSEVEMAKWIRFTNPRAIIILQGWNGWPQRLSAWSDADLDRYGEEVAKQLGPYVDIFVFGLEPTNKDFNTDPDRATVSGKARTNRQANRIARKVRSILPNAIVSGPSWNFYADAIVALDQLPDCNAVSANPYNWSRRELEAFSIKAGNRMVIHGEFGSQVGSNTPAQQAQANERIRMMLSDVSDMAFVYTLRIPNRPDGKPEVNAVFMAAFEADGRARGELAGWMDTKIATARPLTQDHVDVARRINEYRLSVGLNTLRWDDSLAAVAQAAVDKPGLMAEHEPAAQGRGLGAILEGKGTVLQAIDEWRNARAVNAEIAAAKITGRYTKIGVGVAKSEQSVEVYAIFGP